MKYHHSQGVAEALHRVRFMSRYMAIVQDNLETRKHQFDLFDWYATLLAKDLAPLALELAEGVIEWEDLIRTYARKLRRLKKGGVLRDRDVRKRVGKGRSQ